MSTYTTSTSETFTITHARHLVSKIAADLRLSSNYYGTPTESMILDYIEELVVLLKDGYVSTYEFGFKTNDTRIVSCKYEVFNDGSITTDDRAGKIYSCADISGASFYSFLDYSSAWFALTPEKRGEIEASYKIQRTTGNAPGDGNGYWTNDKTYSSGGTALRRGTFRS
jgi:HORMA domain-containing protein